MTCFLFSDAQLVGWFLFGSLMVLTNALMLVYNDATENDGRSLSSPGSLSDWFLNFSGTKQNPDGSVVFASETLNKLTVSIFMMKR